MEKKSIIQPELSSSLHQIIAAIIVSYACIAAGAFLGYTSSAVESIQNDSNFNGTLTNDEISLIGSLGPMGAILGSLLNTILLNYFGVKGSLFYGGAPAMIYSWATIAVSSSTSTIMLGRFIGGIGIGITLCCVPLYIASIADVNNRGRLGILPQFMMRLGIFISYSIGALTEWNTHALICLLITAPSVIFLYFAPDPPHWLYANNREGQAMAILEKLFGKSAAVVEFDRYMTLKSSNSSNFCSDDTNRFLWLKPENIKPILISCAIMSLQQLIGVNGIIFYSVTIFKSSSVRSGSNVWTPHTLSILLALVQCLTLLYSTSLIESLGRKTLLLISSVMTGLASAGLSTYFYIINSSDDNYDANNIFRIPLFILIIYHIGFAMGFGPVPWLYLTEILPENIRSVVNPMIIAYAWTNTFVVTQSFLYIVDFIQMYGLFWIYAGFSLVSFIFIAACLPETKGRSFDEIRRHFLSRNKMKKYVTFNNNHVIVVNVVANCNANKPL